MNAFDLFHALPFLPILVNYNYALRPSPNALIFLSSLVLTLASLSLTFSHSGSLEQVLLSPFRHHAPPLTALSWPLNPPYLFIFAPFRAWVTVFPDMCYSQTHTHSLRCFWTRFRRIPMLSLCFVCCPDLALRYFARMASFSSFLFYVAIFIIFHLQTT